ncbi:hypothetical protein [Longitalea arenae]|uniref:hypothetical protein n=1 Tax=Longitalea arenae TaxID=2812558 RepID=UPI0019687BC2|nr:hypothetical protein [Longitalea arenae]
MKNGDRIGVDVIHNNICELQSTVASTTGSYTVQDVLNPVAFTGNNVINEGDVAVINAAISNANRLLVEMAG